ncbi:SDR family NAD(P)-dependent oxidoreductase [Flavilitoribacter nigricans]|uniref:Short-chain dehydrogenase n=1 Tax=Flavilitoribacter nigricans (strain ATCC 23147 / DSM 23189 / NBRC 102662 / NCIMB 1420 / SS-2) TaxID=1122177 RepID=A0A2D0NBC8_FLAN2|nr:SDR family NAD(P)-dependent oxidoreductase [Flavilitoribacter nigricans]PHN05797.1 short-chain dehydrogenase [Flavilitoribacter nigricans DSM 23189 = NBRC 102662]
MNEPIFKDQVAIVTGAGIGIGFEIAAQLCHRGARVVLNDIDEELAFAAVEKIKSSGGQALALPGDSSELTRIDSMVDLAVSTFGRLDLAVANAGITTFGKFLEYPPDQFQRLTAVNLQGSFFLAQKAARQMVRQKSGGRILFMSSVTGHQAHPSLAAYGMTKAALEMLAKSLGVELAEHGITVNAVAPGATLTDRTVSDPDYQATWKRITPNGRAATTLDIAHAALFLLSPLSGHITGQAIVVDGGWTAVSPPPF